MIGTCDYPVFLNLSPRGFGIHDDGSLSQLRLLELGNSKAFPHSTWTSCSSVQNLFFLSPARAEQSIPL